MAKKKKQTKRKKQTLTLSEQAVFWSYTGAVLLMIIAVFLLMGGFGAGGELPRDLFDGTFWGLGWVAYFTPIALIFFGILKFTSEDKRIPLPKLLSMSSFLLFASAWAHVAFTSLDSQTGQFYGGNGGSIGRLIGSLVLHALDKIPASLLFFVLAIFAFFLTFGISPRVILALIEYLKTQPDKDIDLSALKKAESEPQFKLTEGVPIVRSSDEKNSRLSSFKDTAQRLSPSEDHEALTVPIDSTWKFPPIDMLDQKQDKADAGDVEGNAKTIKDSFANFNIHVDMEGANVGPRVTQYTLRPPTGVKLTKITALENNLSLDLAAHSIRMEAPIPGKRLVGVEVPNKKSATVRISSIFSSSEWKDVKSPLGFVIGKDIAGGSIVGDLERMPHLLIAGQTGSGKSVMINTILTSLLYRNSPSDLKLILVDPKQVELTPYDAIPHLITPVIHEPEKCISALKWAVAEMERRLRTIASEGRRNIIEYNNLKKEEGMPYIVIVIDELADLMMVAARDVESLVVRIAQKARASGIHLVLATQRPSVDVITGLIKANVPARIAFTTASQVDSRTIIDQMGAEKLLGQGDMLLLTSDMPKPKRVQGAFISDTETHKITDFIREQRPPQYDDEVISQPVNLSGRGGRVADYGANDADDDMWRDAVKVVIESGKASTSLLQRRLRVGYGRAARLIETMEEKGIVSSADGNKPREVLISSLDDVFGGGEVGVAPAGEGDVYDDM